MEYYLCSHREIWHEPPPPFRPFQKRFLQSPEDPSRNICVTDQCRRKQFISERVGNILRSLITVSLRAITALLSS